MCGRYEIHNSPQMLMLYFLLAEEPTAYSNADVRPTNEALIIRVCDRKPLALPPRRVDPIVGQGCRHRSAHVQCSGGDDRRETQLSISVQTAPLHRADDGLL